jgi:antitoxin CptB
MTGENGASADVHAHLDETDAARRRIRVRAWRRGMREMDLLLGGFTDARVDALNAAELAQFEALLEAPDDEAFRWFCAGAAPAPFDTPLFAKILAFHLEREH